MVELRLWLRKTSPYVTVLGALAVTTAGCRSARDDWSPAAAVTPYGYGPVGAEPLLVAPYEDGLLEPSVAPLLEPLLPVEPGLPVELDLPAPPAAEAASPAATSGSSIFPPSSTPLKVVDTAPAPNDGRESAAGKVTPKAEPLDSETVRPDSDIPVALPDAVEKPVPATVEVTPDDGQPESEEAAAVRRNPVATVVKPVSPGSAAAPSADEESRVPDPTVNVADPVGKTPDKAAVGLPSPDAGESIPEQPLTPAVKPSELPVTEPTAAVTEPVTNEPTAEQTPLPALTNPSETKPSKPEPVAVAAPSNDGPGDDLLPTLEPGRIASRPVKSIDLPMPDAQPSQAEDAGRVQKPVGGREVAVVDRGAVNPPIPDLPVTSVVKNDAKPAGLPAAETGKPKSAGAVAAVLPGPAIIARTTSPVVAVGLDHDGNVLVSHRDGISRVNADGSVAVMAAMSSPRSLVALRDGSLAVCEASQRAVVKVGSEGRVDAVLVRRSDGNFLRAPSHVIADSEQGLYFTDPGYARISTPIGRLHYVDSDGRVNLVAQRLAWPEGIALSSDGTSLFVVESQADRIVRFELLSAGRVGPSQPFAKLADSTDKTADNFATGLSIGQDGTVYVARHGLQRVDVFEKSGRFDRSLPTPDVLLTDLAISADGRTLFGAGIPAGNQESGIVVKIDLKAGR